jgi:hypothetical protein
MTEFVRERVLCLRVTHPISAADRDRFNVPREETWAKVKETLGLA